MDFFDMIFFVLGHHFSVGLYIIRIFSANGENGETDFIAHGPQPLRNFLSRIFMRGSGEIASTDPHGSQVLGLIASVASLTRACYSVPLSSALTFCLVWFMISTDDE